MRGIRNFNDADLEEPGKAYFVEESIEGVGLEGK